MAFNWRRALRPLQARNGNVIMGTPSRGQRERARGESVVLLASGFYFIFVLLVEGAVAPGNFTLMDFPAWRCFTATSLRLHCGGELDQSRGGLAGWRCECILSVSFCIPPVSIELQSIYTFSQYVSVCTISQYIPSVNIHRNILYWSPGEIYDVYYWAVCTISQDISIYLHSEYTISQ